MTTKILPRTSPLLFDQLPPLPEAIEPAMPDFLTVEDIVSCQHVCRRWKNHPAFNITLHRENAFLAKNAGYPREILDAFLAKRISLLSLPVIIHANRDYRLPTIEDMPLTSSGEPASLALVERPYPSRPGIAMLIQGQVEGTTKDGRPISELTSLVEFRARSFGGLVHRDSFFYRYYWQLRSNPEIDIPFQDGIRNPLSYPFDPAIRVNPRNTGEHLEDPLLQLIAGTEKTFKLQSPISLLDTPRPLPPARHQPEPQHEQPSCLDQIISWACWVFCLPFRMIASIIVFLYHIFCDASRNEG
jgi:hypothetical protein